MFRLLNAELYKLRKSKSLIICIMVTAGFVFLMYGTMLLVDNIQQGKIENGTAGVMVMKNGTEATPTDSSIWDEIGVMDMMQQVFSGDVITTILAIFISIFVIREYGSGMMKNIAGKGFPRSSIYLSKLFASALAAVCMALIGMIGTLLAGRIFIGAGAFAGDFWKNLLIYGALELLMLLSLASIFVCIGEMVRNLAGGISIGIGIAVLPDLLLNVIDMQFAGSATTPSAYWLVTRMSHCPFEGFTAGYAAETMLVAALWFLLSTGLGIWHFYRSDIK